ncbi:hypothetical protein CYMTET_36585, partial [Cymbomonas tetramitiformis]
MKGAEESLFVSRSLNCEVIASDSIPASGSTVLVIGATGGVGQLTTAKLLERGYKVRAFVRDELKAETVLGTAEGLEVAFFTALLLRAREGLASCFQRTECRRATGAPSADVRQRHRVQTCDRGTECRRAAGALEADAAGAIECRRATGAPSADVPQGHWSADVATGAPVQTCGGAPRADVRQEHRVQT